MAARPRLLLSIMLAAVSAVVLAACGGDEDVGEIPADSAATMLAALEDARAAEGSDPRDCEAIADAASAVANESDGLPESEVRQALIAAAENLHDLAKSDACGPTTTGRTGPQDDDDTTTTTTTPTTTTTEETTTTPEDDDGDDGGNGGNGGRGGGGNGGGPPPQPPGEGGGGLGGGNQGGQPPDTGGTGGGGAGSG